MAAITHVVDTAEPQNHRTSAPDRQPDPDRTERVPLHGAIDWPRRFDHMQQHTGQHVLSAAFDRLFDARTVSFHLGAEMSTIDISRELSPAEIAAAEEAANEIVWEDRPVAIRYATAEEAPRNCRSAKNRRAAARCG